MGLNHLEIDNAQTGDIVTIAGFETVDVGDMICDENNPNSLDPMHIEEPTLSLFFNVNLAVCRTRKLVVKRKHYEP